MYPLYKYLTITIYYCEMSQTYDMVLKCMQESHKIAVEKRVIRDNLAQIADHLEKIAIRTDSTNVSEMAVIAENNFNVAEDELNCAKDKTTKLCDILLLLIHKQQQNDTCSRTIIDRAT